MIQLLLGVFAIKAAIKIIKPSTEPDAFQKLSHDIDSAIASGRSRGRAAIEAEDRRDRQRALQPKTAPAPEYPLGFCIIWGFIMLFFVMVVFQEIFKPATTRPTGWDRLAPAAHP